MFAPTQPVAIQQAQAEPGNTDWIGEAVAEAVKGFTEELQTIVNGAYEAGKNSEPENVNANRDIPFTCADCVFVNVKDNKCDKFNMMPPLFVIFDAANQCGDFLNVHTTEDEIPF